MIEQFQATFSDHIIAIEASDMPTFVIRKESVLPVLTQLFKDFKVQFLTDLCGIHYPDAMPPMLGVVYHLHALTTNTRLRIKAFTPVSEPHFPSIVSLFSAANWMERETYDFFGIIFDGHPNLKRILNEDGMTYFPMRKEYPLEEGTRTDKDDAQFGREKTT
jgi:NADH-quinone oxidoreductase subunit C